ncbi:hypothetical protein M8445_10875 [Deinococcus aquaticus]|uniref:Uncharacterized protein n=1 Tax=Deinococcus aquaticus TaxID=328692 RepID=A0ABY7UY69_9DEIO|nr:hypothetical protein [Deinococcus aquaticus]WDA57852.1 hypothetical protein M8445_10875 [Deinococcus aquaticus]
MIPDYLPNTFPAPKWARVVQAVTWAEYGLNEEGRITEKSVRGPVIVWGRTSGEGEDLPRLEAPTPSPLELETARLNMRPHIQAFVRCAQGRGRNAHGKRVGFLCLWRGVNKHYRKSMCMRSALFSPDAIVVISNGAELICDIHPKYIFSQFRLKRHYRKIRLEEKAGNATLDICFTDDLIQLLLEVQQKINRGIVIKPADLPGIHPIVAARTLRALFGKVDLSGFVSHFYRKDRALHLLLILKMQRAVYRAHIARRVRPVRRRSRIRRPLYARPRPPTCPLAPPVA